jgi:phytoene dehydrogenase-like protein
MSRLRQGFGAQGSAQAVVIGAGHNGLAAAHRLAAGGLNTLVLERRDEIGGGAVTGLLHPGFHCPTLSHNVLIHERIVREMDLRGHGVEFLSPAGAVFAPSINGAIAFYDDPARSADRLRRGSAHDAAALADFRDAVRRVASVVATTLESPPPRIDGPGAGDVWSLLKTGRAFRALETRDAHRMLRWLPMPVADLVGEWFDTDAVCAAIAAPGLSGTMLGPRSAGSTLVMMLNEAHQLLAGGVRRVRGGPGQLSRAMATAAQSAGAVIRTHSPVEQITVASGRVTGVVVAGKEIPASVVLSTLDPKTTLLGMSGAEHLGPGVVSKLHNYRAHGTVAKVNLALAGLPAFEGAGPDDLSGRIHIGPTLDYMERAFDHAKYGEVSADPWLEVTIPTILDPGLAPEGAHVMSVYVHYAPRHLRTGSWSTCRDAMLASTLRVLERHAPAISSLIVEAQLLTPEDLDREYGLAGGHIFHGELAADQLFMMRPILGYGRYESPIRGLFFAGAGSHPGGFLTGASGRLAAREALRRS